MTRLSIDQSLSKCSVVVWEGETAVERYIIKTGSAGVKKKLKAANYFDTTEEQIHFICKELLSIIEYCDPNYIIFESLSLASTGNATRDLACLYGALVEMILSNTDIEISAIQKVAPTTLKKFARGFLPEDEQFDGMTKAGKPKLVKMDKKLMVKAAGCAGGSHLLEGLKMSGENAGLDDVSDAYLLGLYSFK